MIPMRIIGTDIYLNLINHFQYKRLMITTRFINIGITMKGIYENELDLSFSKIWKANNVNVNRLTLTCT